MRFQIALEYVAILFSIQLTAFAGGHRGVVTPVPIPNTEVKGSFAEGSAGLARARVGRRRLFYFLRKVYLHSSNRAPASPIGRTPLATALRLAALGGYSGFFISFERHPIADPFSFFGSAGVAHDWLRPCNWEVGFSIV